VQPLILDKPTGNTSRILILGAHSDDIEIGVGGTLLTMAESNLPVSIDWVIFSASSDRRREAEASIEQYRREGLEIEARLLSFRDGYFPSQHAQIKDSFEDIKSSVNPDVIFTHYQHDRHQDHRIVSELTWNTFRDHLIFEYEIPKYDGDLDRPNFFVPIPSPLVNRKADLLLEAFTSQESRDWFTADTFRAIMRIRGVECHSDSGYAEAFHLRKAVWSLSHYRPR
jgi:LmbE family N-acetylglucosaminyl deacetylase